MSVSLCTNECPHVTLICALTFILAGVPQRSHQSVWPLLVHKTLSGIVGLTAAYAFIHARPAPALAAALLVMGMTAVAWNNSFPSRINPHGRAAGKRRLPNFHAFLLRRLGSPARPMKLLGNFFLRPLAAPSFGAFWREWNPPLGYVLLFFVYQPARRHLPRPVARYVVFLVSGVLHDVIANGGDLLRGRPDLSVTALFAIFGVMTLASEAMGMDLSRWPRWVRASANLLLLAAGFGLRHVVRTIAGG